MSMFSDALGSAKSILPGSEPQEESVCDGLGLTYTQRMYGFAGCFVAGWLISFLSSISFWSGNTDQFAVLYTLGNVMRSRQPCHGPHAPN